MSFYLRGCRMRFYFFLKKGRSWHKAALNPNPILTFSAEQAFL